MPAFLQLARTVAGIENAADKAEPKRLAWAARQEKPWADSPDAVIREAENVDPKNNNSRMAAYNDKQAGFNRMRCRLLPSSMTNPMLTSRIPTPGALCWRRSCS